MKPYGTPRIKAALSPDVGDLMMLGAATRWVKMKPRHKAAVRRRWARTARRNNRLACSEE